MKFINILWWILFIFVALIAQSFFTGLDFIVIGFILLLQEEDLKQLLFVAPLLFFIQEGMSTFAFGSTLLWYIAAFTLLLISKCLFEVENFLFMLLFSSALAFAHIGIYVLMAQLQNMDYNIDQLLDDSVLQALSMPCLWYLLVLTRPKKQDPTLV